jgi:hypothetical protein
MTTFRPIFVSSVPGISTVVGIPAVFSTHAVVGVTPIVGILLLLTSLNNLTVFIGFSLYFVLLSLAFLLALQILTVSLQCKISEKTHFFALLCIEMISLPSRPFRFGTESEQRSVPYKEDAGTIYI